jgi:hypothetical protein
VVVPKEVLVSVNVKETVVVEVVEDVVTWGRFNRELTWDRRPEMLLAWFWRVPEVF